MQRVIRDRDVNRRGHFMNETDSPMFEVRASTTRVRMSSHKVRKVVDQIRDCSCDRALRLLRRMRYGACAPVFKLLTSASANARESLGTNKTRLWISQVQVDEAPILKRMRPRAQGRGYSIHKPSCSITLLVKRTDRAALVTQSKRPRRKLKRRRRGMSSTQPHHSVQR